MQTVTGSCHCGANTFSVEDEPEFQFVCYCTNCRVINSGGHLCGVMFDEATFKPAQAVQVYSFEGGSGQPIDLSFCPNCGTHLYAFPKSAPGKVVVRANTIDETVFAPQKDLFPESRFKWDM